ncbi:MULTISPECIES: CopD family protein [Halorussus]|uniref:CopD family protein n=1 Tax=Halorussus TaxID=1070314 RepID=UPI0020A1F067|nr:CopD family protein [Halorussus vallis]USZ74613.1 CopD family protein [Halorussus vallis]
MAALVVPAARDGRLGSSALVGLTERFARFSQVAPLVMLVTGGYMASLTFISDSLLKTTRGQLVLTMVGLWVVLSALTNVASRRLTADVESVGAERSARGASTAFSAAAAVALALLLVGGWI